MCSSDLEVSYDLSVIRFIADGPDGKAHTWSLANGGDIYRSISARYKFKNSGDWAEAYKDGRKDPDSDMSEWVGATAVAFDDGWLIISGKLDEGKTQFYYLTMTD